MLDRLRRRDDRLVIYGHRGARGAFPENTMPGFAYLIDIGIDAVEIDVLAAADNVPVVTHNPRLLAETTRGPDGTWLDQPGPRILQTPLAALQQFDIGAIRNGTGYHAKFPDQARLSGVAVPTLDAFCAWASQHPTLVLNIEIKSFPTQPGLAPPPDDLVAMTLAQLRRHGVAERVILQSFDWRVIHACRAQAPDIPRSYLSQLKGPAGPSDANIYDGSPWMDGVDPSEHRNSLPQAIADYGGHVWCPYFEDLNQEDLDRAHALGLLVNVWTVNTPDDLHRMAVIGVDGIITDFPARAQNVLDGMGLGWLPGR